jgi:hypothetical protein
MAILPVVPECYSISRIGSSLPDNSDVHPGPKLGSRGKSVLGKHELVFPGAWSIMYLQ